MYRAPAGSTAPNGTGKLDKPGSPHLRQWGAISSFRVAEWHDRQLPPSNMVIFLEVSGSWNTSIPLASPAPFLSPACSANWKISELCSALSSNITKQKYLVGLQLMSVLTVHSKAFESSSVWSPTWSSLAAFWWVNLGLTFAPKWCSFVACLLQELKYPDSFLKSLWHPPGGSRMHMGVRTAPTFYNLGVHGL